MFQQASIVLYKYTKTLKIENIKQSAKYNILYSADYLVFCCIWQII